MDAADLIANLGASVQLAVGSGNVVLLVGKDPGAVEEARGPLLASLRATGPLRVDDLGVADPKAGPRAWVERAQASSADACALVIRTEHILAARSFARRLNGEREHLRGLGKPLILLTNADDERALREIAPDFFTWIAQTHELPSGPELSGYARQIGAVLEAAPNVVLPSVQAEGVATITAPPPIRFLHLSDIHFKTGDARAYDQEKVLRGLLETLRRERAERPLDLIFFTGDLAQAAAAAEYDRAVAFLRELMEAGGVPPERVFVVPGNHDVDRRVGRWTLRTLGSLEDATLFFVEAENRRLHEAKFAAYRDKLGELLGADRALGLRVGAEAVEVVEVRGAKIAVASFNSAWFAVGDDDLEKLWLGEANVDRAAARIAVEDGVVASFALMHHPTEHLCDKERATVEAYLERSFDVVLRGHLHKDRSRGVHTGRGEFVELAAPAAYQGSQWPNGCFVGELEASPRALRVRPYKFGSGADPWVLDTTVFPHDADGCHTFALRAERRGAVAARIAAALRPVAKSVAAEVQRAHPMGATLTVGTEHGALRGLEVRVLLEELAGQQKRLSRPLQVRIVEGLVPLMPAPPEPRPPWGREAFEGMLQRFVAFWAANGPAYEKALGGGDARHEMVASAFFQRQSGYPVTRRAHQPHAMPDLVIEAEGPRAAIEVTRAEHPAALSYLDRDESFELRAVLWFVPERPAEQRGVKRLSAEGERPIWLVSL